MNKRIFDLLDACEDDSVELADAAPLSSARIKELTMKNINKNERKCMRRAPFRLLAAAVAAAALIFSAVATNAFGAGDSMKGLFADTTASQVDILNRMGAVLTGGGVTSNGATITPIAALADEDCYYLQLRVEAPDGVVLPDLPYRSHYYLELEDYSTWPCLEVSWAQLVHAYPELFSDWFDPDEEPAGYHSLSLETYFEALPDDDPTDNVKDLVICFHSNGFDDIKLNDGLTKRLVLKGLTLAEAPLDLEYVTAADITYTEIFSGTFILDIDAQFQNSMVTIDCGGAVWTDPDTGETNCLETMKFSPLGLKFEYRSNLSEFRDGQRWLNPTVPGDTRIVMKDGSEIFAEPCFQYFVLTDEEPCFRYFVLTDDADLDWDDPFYQITPDLLTETPEWERGYYWRFYKEPLDLTQVDYVQFGEDYIYPINVE